MKETKEEVKFATVRHYDGKKGIAHLQGKPASVVLLDVHGCCITSSGCITCKPKRSGIFRDGDPIVLIINRHVVKGTLRALYWGDANSYNKRPESVKDSKESGITTLKEEEKDELTRRAEIAEAEELELLARSAGGKNGVPHPHPQASPSRSRRRRR